MTALDDLIDDLEDWLEEAEGTQGVNGQSGPLSGDPLTYVSDRLADVLSNIVHGLSSEHLNDVGTADLTGLPSDLPGVAGWCHDKAVDARVPSLSDGDLGSLLQSRRDAINQAPGGYQNLAGV